MYLPAFLAGRPGFRGSDRIRTSEVTPILRKGQARFGIARPPRRRQAWGPAIRTPPDDDRMAGWAMRDFGSQVLR